jgi:zinc transport system substrate-binding protein
VRADGAFEIATSFYPLQFALERIAGDLAEVTNVGAGRDPHDFRPSTRDVVALQRADLVVLQGAMFEPWGEEVATQLRQAEVPVVLATADLTLIPSGDDHHDHSDHDGAHADEHNAAHSDEADHAHNDEHDHDHAHDHGAFDPHTWLDPVLFSETVRHLTEALSTLDPDNAATYQANADELLTELVALDTEYQTSLARCDLSEVITSHDAFGYLGARYNITIHSIAGLSTQDLPSAQTLANLRDEAAEGAGAILLEQNSVTAYGETLANETGLTTLSINPIAYTIPAGEDYLTLMRANLNVFEEALRCNG